MESVLTLIARGQEVCGNKRRLADHIGCSEQNLQGVIHGRRHFTPQNVLALALCVGSCPLSFLAVTTIARETSAPQRAALNDGFFPGSRLFVERRRSTTGSPPQQRR